MRLTRRECLLLAGAGALTNAAAAEPGTAMGLNQADRAETWPPPGSGATPTPPRTPKFPLKTARTLHTDAEIKQAQENIRRFANARARLDDINKAADPWLEWSDADLARLVTPASVPRAFDVGATIGCPKCGQAIHEKFGTYPWLADLRKPFKLTCPVDGSVYPDNDYAAYLQSNFTQKVGWDKPIVDDGWGWRNPANGERYWFVAHYSHRIWHRHLGPGLDALSKAYLLTGDRRYSHKAAVLLWHIARVYPAMDHEKQSRYGLLSRARGIRYPGKVLNHIWETALATTFAQAYDAVWETLDSDEALHKIAQTDGRGVRSFMEANLLEEIIDGYYKGQIVGNFGMHQNTVAHTTVVRQHGDSARWLGSILDGTNPPAPTASHLGLRYALYNSVFRDGIPSESAPGYNNLWLAKFTDIAVLLQKGGRDLFREEPRLRRMYDAVIAQVNAQKFTPDWGDSGSVWGDTSTGRSANIFLPAARAYKEPAFARFVSDDKAGEVVFPTAEALFLPPPDAAPSRATADASAPRSSRLLDGAGLGILCNPADTVSATLTYGWKAGHGHFDRLNFELFAGGVPLMPDLGYPDAMNDYVSGIYTWNKNTVAHNTVVVDAARQGGNVPGAVKLLAQSPHVRTLDVDASQTYAQTREYRRALVMVDTEDGSAYFVDVFKVAGGGQHDYSLHGPPGPYAPVNADGWGKPEEGTLAGRNVPLGQIYDNPKMGAADYKGGYSGYTGSGFQHLYNVRRRSASQSGDAVCVEWQHEKKPETRLRIHVLPQSEQEFILAEALTSPIKKAGRVGYFLARRTGSPDLSSRFVSIIEPITGSGPLIASVRVLPLAAGEGVALEVRRTTGAIDLVLYDPAGSGKRVLWGTAGEVMSDAQIAVLTQQSEGASSRLNRVFVAGRPEGCALSVEKRTFRATGYTGKVAAVFPQKNQILVTAGQGNAPKAGEVILLSNPWRTSPAAYTVTAAQKNGDGWMLTTHEALLVGRAPLKSVSNATLTVDSVLPLAATYPGAAVYASNAANTAATPCGIVLKAEGAGTLHIKDAATGLPKVGSDIEWAHAAPGDVLGMSSVYAQTLE